MARKMSSGATKQPQKRSHKKGNGSKNGSKHASKANGKRSTSPVRTRGIKR